MPIFTIESVTTHVSRERRAGRVQQSRTLELEGPSGEGGRSRAFFVFDAEPSTPAVGYITRADAAGVSLVGWLPEAAYRTFRAAVAEGGALEVQYETRDDSSGYLRRLALGRPGAAPVAAVAHLPGDSAGASFAMPH
ncbi:MAG: hypothetical protein U1E59_07835 [Amaricoccus sp.]